MELNTYINAASEQFEEIPDEELIEDGELELSEVLNKIKARVFIEGDWKIIRRTNDK